MTQSQDAAEELDKLVYDFKNLVLYANGRELSDEVHAFKQAISAYVGKERLSAADQMIQAFLRSRNMDDAHEKLKDERNKIWALAKDKK